MATNIESTTDDSTVSCKVSSAAPNEICWIDAHINSLFEVRLHPGLKSLNLHCNNISVIENLSRLRHLTHLDLSSNHIRRIEGLGELNRLKSLNLSCNELYIVEGLENLRNLTRLDLSYNMVNNLSGLKSLHGPGFSLTFLYLHGNQLRSLDHVINCTVGCHNLRELSLSLYGEGNPVCEMAGYRTKVLAALHMVEVLDGLDRFGNLSAAKGGLFSFPELDSYMEYLQSTSTSESPNLKTDHRYELVTPRIDVVLDRFRQRGPLSSETDPGEDIRIDEPITLEKKPDGRVSLSADHEVRLETLEHQISHLIHNTDKARVPKKSRKGVGNSNSDESDESGSKKPVPSSPKPGQSRQAPISRKVQSKRRSKPSVTVTMDTSSSTSPTDDQARKLTIKGKALKGRPVRDPEDDATVLSLMQELDAERERRWKAEEAARRMVDVVKELQLKESEECKLREASLAATSRLKRSLLKEKETNSTLQTALTQLQVQKTELSEELHRLKETEVNQQKALRAMEQAATKMETEKMRQHAEALSQLQKEQMKTGALSKETALLKHSVKQLKAQVHQLQELLANREQEHRMAAEGLVRVDSPEVRALVDQEVAKQDSCHQQVVNQFLERLNKRDLEYAALEDEFRLALQIEANRFRELQEAFERVSDDCAQQKEALYTIKQKESKASGMVNELTAMVKEQRGRITELSRGRQEIIGEYKERLQTVERQLSEANKQLTRLEVLEQDKAKLSAQIRAQGSVIEGLRSERKLWGEELAQQGASLAQDRGRMESRIEALTAEISEVKKECQNAHDTVSIKSKIIEDQTDSIRKLKQKIADQDAKWRNLEEESRTREQNLEEQLATESTANQELQEQLDALLDRKESLKQELSKTQTELQTSRENHRMLKSKWQEKSELIGKLEKEVVEMRNTFKEKENKLSEERDKAITAANSAVEKLKNCDDAFRKQLEQQRQTHQQQVDRLTTEKQQEIELVNAKILEVEDEMRMLLQENALTKKTLEQRLKKLTTAFTEMQHDLART